jgi:hypothetical protein
MLGTLFGLIIVIFGAVIYLDPEARRPRDHERSLEEQTVGDERSREEQTADESGR